MRHFHFILVTGLLILVIGGCEADARIKRQTSLVNTKTQVAASEYQQADTPVKKLVVADEYFRTAPKMTQVLEDYMFGREPAPDTSAPAPDATTTTTSARDMVPVNVSK